MQGMPVHRARLEPSGATKFPMTVRNAALATASAGGPGEFCSACRDDLILLRQLATQN
jgi:hypothetical protein